MSISIEHVKTFLEKELPGISLKKVRESLLLQNPADLPSAARALKDSSVFKLDFLSSITGADYLDYLEAVYHFYSMQNKTGAVTLRVRVKRGSPNIPTLVPVYRGAEFQEREAYDMYGIVFEGHPDLRRIFMWDGFEGFPLRKDYEQEDSETLEIADVQWLEKRSVQIPAEMKQKAEELHRDGKRAIARQPTDKNTP